MTAGRPSKVLAIERRYDSPIDQVLRDLVGQGKEPGEIGQEVGLGKSRVYDLLKEYEIEIKSKSNLESGFQSYFGDFDSDFTRLIDDYIIDKQVGGKTEKTIEFYRSNLARYVWWLRESGISLKLSYCFTPEVIRRFILYVQTSKVRFGGLRPWTRVKLKRSTVDTYYRTLNAFASWLVSQKKLRESPLDQIERPGFDKVIIPDIPDLVLTTILNSFDNSLLGKRDKAITWLFYDSGIRLAELVGIKISDLNLDAGEVKVFGKGRKERLAGIGETTKTSLIEYLKLREPLARTENLFITSSGQSLGYHSVRRMYEKFKPQFPGVPLHPHAFRHKFALEILRNSGDLVALQMLGGWSDLNMPRHYAGAIQQEDALRVHKTASPADNLVKRNGNGKGDGNETKSNEIGKE